MTTDTSKLAQTAKEVRKAILHMANRSQGPHIGSCLSVVEILVYLYFCELKLDPSNPEWTDRDYFILSKGHAAMALYAVLAEKGIIERKLLEGYMLNNGTLPAHLDKFSASGIEVSAGSLGHGLSIGLGIAHGMKLRGKFNRVFVLMGDGESQEGSVWEAAMMAPRLGVNNLVAMIDHNNLQGYGRPCEIMYFQPVAEKWKAFGWHAVEADGHDFVSLEKAFASAITADKPAVVILNTTKGKGVSYMEDELKWHYFILTDELFEKAKRELTDA
ncbi:MAG: transketolase [Pseudomonadota bacterium]